jgi:chromosome segregation ATPase
MWPRILLELLPHFTRLMPPADKYLNNRTASDEAQKAALAALAQDVRGEIGGVTEEQAGLRRQLQEQTAQIAQVGVEVTRARLGIESVEARVTKLERTAEVTVRLLVIALVLLVGLSALVVVLFFKLKVH